MTPRAESREPRAEDEARRAASREPRPGEEAALRPLVIGTRGSRLAVWQAEHVASRLRAAFPTMALRLERIRTTGDKILDVPLAQVGGKALFVKEIEEALLAGRVDLAVHSMKDVPTDLPPGLTIAAIPRREDAADVLISRTGRAVGGSAPRRAGRDQQPAAPGAAPSYPAGPGHRGCARESGHADPEVVQRGARCHRPGGGGSRAAGARTPGDGGAAAGGALACHRSGGAGDRGARAGGREPRAGSREPRAASPTAWRSWWGCSTIGRRTWRCVRNGRCSSASAAGCQVPVAAWATVEADAILLRGLIAATDGVTVIRGEARGTVGEPETVGRDLAEDLLERGGQAILGAILGGRLGA